MVQLEFDKWYPIEEYFKRDNVGYVWVQFREIKTNYYPIPKVVKYEKHGNTFVPYEKENNNVFPCNLYEPIKFRLFNKNEYENRIKEEKEEVYRRLDALCRAEEQIFINRER